MCEETRVTSPTRDRDRVRGRCGIRISSGRVPDSGLNLAKKHRISPVNPQESARRSVSRVLSRPAGRGWPFIWDARRRTPRATDPSGGAKARPAAPAMLAACRSYLVLLPVGFSLPPPLPAARCALTAPFHPCRPCRPEGDGRARRYIFCGTFPGVAPAGRYPAPYLRGARTFLPRPREPSEERPSDRLAWDDVGKRSIPVKRGPYQTRPLANAAPQTRPGECRRTSAIKRRAAAELSPRR